MSSFTISEQQSYAAMQARLIELLLRHDEQRFRQFYYQLSNYEQERESDGLERYRELGVLFYLRDELFEHILPRIVRRLSFESPRSTIIEEPPARGRVDWDRTLDAVWAERPGEPPLLLHTRQRRRDFATPENLLAVATLLEYSADVEHILWNEQISSGAEALRHPLNEIVERCERELAFPQFAGLRQAAQRIVDGQQGGTETLEAQVHERLLPGGNSGYEELLDWRQRRRSLRLLNREAAAQSDVLGANPKRDNYLYQLWIFYELADFLRDQQRLVRLDSAQGGMHMRFRWGDGASACLYELRHDQGVPDPVISWQTGHPIARVPGVRPDFYLVRVDPPVEKVEVEGKLYWREPGVVWDAKYYREREREKAPSTPIKRMIADLTLLGETSGTLLFAFLEGPQNRPDEEDLGVENARLAESGYTLRPLTDFDQALGPRPTVTNVELRPLTGTDLNRTRKRLAELLTKAHQRLHERRIPRCQGIFLDPLSAANHSELVNRYGVALESAPGELLICPKVHIGPWRVDLVSREAHCLNDPAFCHIINQPGAIKPVRPPRSPEELLRELQHIFSQKGALDDEMVSVIAKQVEGITRRFAEIAGVYRRIDVYYNRLRDLGMEQTLHLLGPAERESLALALFLVEQLDSIGAQDYSAPAIHISSVVEVEIKRRIFTCPNLVGNLTDPHRQTLGVLPHLQRNPDDINWQRISYFAYYRWDEQIIPGQQISFEDFIIKTVSRIAVLRNTAAHTDPLPRHLYAELQRIVCQNSLLGDGALNILLMAWK